MCSCRASRRLRRYLLGLICIIAVIICLLSVLINVQPTLMQLAALHTCPACFGTTVCSYILQGTLSLNSASTLSGLTGLLGTKNVITGTFKGQSVIVKRLGHVWELEKLDNSLCAAAGLSKGCWMSEVFQALGDTRSLVMDYLSQSSISNGHMNNFHLCPSVTNIDVLFRNVFQNNKNVTSEEIYAQIWTLLHLNAEPIILQILPAEEEWPVPRYIGACGRLVVEEFAGNSLNHYWNAPWKLRARLALQLLSAAGDFTDRHPTFRFYLTDVSSDNVVVDAAHRIRFVDLENVIILEKNPHDKDKSALWSTEHVSENYDCDGCFAFSTDEICSHHLSDHNFYAVCQELLWAGGSGLLADIPAAVLRNQPSLPQIVHNCATTTGHVTRRHIVHRLMAALTATLQLNMSAVN